MPGVHRLVVAAPAYVKDSDNPTMRDRVCVTPWSVSRHHLHVAAIPTKPATTAPLFQCKAIHEGIRVRELIMRMNGTGCHGQDTEYLTNLGEPRFTRSYAIGNCREAGRSLLGG